MTDPRIVALSKNLIGYSCGLKPGERVLIEATSVPGAFVEALIEQAYAAGGVPLYVIEDPCVKRALLMQAAPEQLDFMAEIDAARMKGVQAYIGLRGSDNIYESSDVPGEQNKLYMLHYVQKVHMRIRVPDTKWVVLRYPSPAMAQLAGMSTKAFEDFYFQVCNFDYARMSLAMDALVARLERTDKVRIVGPGLDLSFSISGIPAIKCDGKMNIPDGEVYTAPVKDSVEGTVTFNTPSMYNGKAYENIRLTFEKGRIVSSDGSDRKGIEQILNTDEGARYVGEFALGVNPYINRPMKDTLFDEKIAGSFHFTPGNSYFDAFNGNKSAVHWDMVCIQTPEYGGGEIWFDGELVRRDGLFVAEDLLGVNPDALT